MANPLCADCKQPKEPGRYDAYCKACRSRYSKAYTQGKKKGGKKRSPRYSLFSPQDKEELYEYQEHKCGICGKEKEIGQLVVDHDHESGETRGLLCTKCNQAIGFFGDDVMLLTAAICYLETWPRELKDLDTSSAKTL